MTDIVSSGGESSRTQQLVRSSLKRRKAAQTRLKLYGITAITFALVMLAILVGSVVTSSMGAWTQTQVRLEIPPFSSAEEAAEKSPRAAVNEAILSLFPATEERKERRAITSVLSDGAQYDVEDAIAAAGDAVTEGLDVWVPVSDPYEQLYEGVIDPTVDASRRPLSDRQIEVYQALDEAGRIRSTFDWGLFTNADSRFPELAGLKGAIIGSFFLLLVCLAVSVPLGVGAAVYLEEYARKNRVTDFIEININNLAAVPSIVFGLLGLALFLGFFGLPRSAPLVGGLVLALMTLPTIIITTRSALKGVPPSIREAARGVGASEMQVIGHHVLPVALPGILTGTIIGLAQALGETAPLLLIGMNAFITSAPSSIVDASTALPTQIFIWFDSPERGFVARTSAAIVVLLMFLTVMNLTAVILRRRFERRW
ncbi:MAG TPA: phosphate ABC transporter permease PstA [Aurantimonas sp.]